MSLPNLSGDALVTWLNDTSAKWLEFFQAHPEALDFPCGIRESKSVRAFLQHIVAVELRYAERLCDLPETAYGDLPSAPAESIVALHTRAMDLLRTLDGHDAAWWSKPITFATRSAGELQSSRQTIFVHLVMHSIRHYAQLATTVRQQGLPSGLTLDYLFLPGNAAPVTG